MLKPFLFVANLPQGVTRAQILEHLNTRQEVKHWYAFFPNAIVVISDRNATELMSAVRQQFPSLHFIVTEIPTGSNNGWLNKDVWEFINNPRSSGRWP
jgi:hypothetical protein